MSFVEATIKSRLKLLEEQENVRILYACESGSRAWGFASQDSDYDVRFIYIRPQNWYLSIYEGHDVIERPVEDGVDLSGWDIRKALKLFRKSNPPLLEWLSSPIVYQEEPSFVPKVKGLMPEYYSPRSCLHHYMHMAHGNFESYLSGEVVNLKKYFYVLRPVLACIWIERGLGVVPMEFAKLVDRIVDQPDLKAEIASLLSSKMSGKELDSGPKMLAIHGFLAREVKRLSVEHGVPEAVKSDVATLDGLFQATLREVWG